MYHRPGGGATVTADFQDLEMNCTCADWKSLLSLRLDGADLCSTLSNSIECSLASHDYFLWEIVWSNCYTLLVTHVQENLGWKRM